MPFSPIEDFLDDAITLPIRGKEYRIQSPDGETGLWIMRAKAIGEAQARGVALTEADVKFLASFAEQDETYLQKRVLGPAWDAMLADGVPWTWIKHATSVAIVWVTQGRERAEDVWAAGAPKAQDPQPTPKPVTPAGSRNRRKAPRATAGSTS